MSTDLIVRQSSETVPMLFRRLIPDEKIEELREQYLPLVVNGIDDAKGLKKVHDARMVMVKMRTSLDEFHKEQKADALAFGRMCDAEKNRIKAMLDPIEQHLKEQEEAIKAEKERIRVAKLQERVNKLMAVEAVVIEAAVQAMDDDAFESYLKDRTEDFNRKQELLRREEEERRALQAKIAERVERLKEVSLFIPESRLSVMTDEDFAKVVDSHVALMQEKERERQAERLRQEQEAARLQQEREELQRRELELSEARRLDEEKAAAERAELARLKKEEDDRLAKKAAELEAKMAAERAEMDRRRQEIEAREQAARREEEARLERERVEREAKEREAAEAAEKARREKLAPARERVIAYAERLRAVEKPDLEDFVDDGLVQGDIDTQVSRLINWLLTFADNI